MSARVGTDELQPFPCIHNPLHLFYPRHVGQGKTLAPHPRCDPEQGRDSLGVVPSKVGTANGKTGPSQDVRLVLPVFDALHITTPYGAALYNVIKHFLDFHTKVGG